LRRSDRIVIPGPRNCARHGTFTNSTLHVTLERQAMTKRDFDSKVAELERLLNDPETRMEPDLVWSLLAEVSRADRAAAQAR
jgi:hypothetical protein